MKTKLILAASVLIFASCNNNNASNTNEQRTIDSLSQALMRQHIIDSMNAATVESTPPAAPVSRRSSSSYGHSQSNTYSGNAPASPAAAPATPSGPTYADYESQRKAENRKKAKSAAIGAAVGAGAGAVGGALSNKDPHFKKENAAIGAGVGAALGAGAGLLIQNRKLKKEKDTAR